MGTILASKIIDNVSIMLQDTSNVRWPRAQLLTWLNDAQREICWLSPEASTKSVALTLVAGTKQSIPTDGMRLISVLRNSPNGRAIRLVDQAVLDAQIPTWHSDTASTTAIHYCFDKRNPKVFYLYPQRPTSPGAVDITYSAASTNVTIETGAITIDDIYANPMTDYMLYRAYLKDAEYTMNADRAKLHLEVFLKSIGAKEGIDATVEPAPSGSSRPALGVGG